jgi:hypothetical protein
LLVLAGQSLNVWLTLRLRVDQAETRTELGAMKNTILDEVDKVYVRQEICKRDMEIATLRVGHAGT